MNVMHNVLTKRMSCSSLGAEESSQSKVPQFDYTLGRDKHIGRFYVPMHDPARVHMVERTADLYEVFPDGLLGDQTILFFEVLCKNTRSQSEGQIKCIFNDIKGLILLISSLKPMLRVLIRIASVRLF